MVRWGNGPRAFTPENRAREGVVPPRLDLPEPAWPTPQWIQWVQVTGNLLSVPKPGPTLFLAVRQIPPRLHQALGSPNGEGGGWGATQIPLAPPERNLFSLGLAAGTHQTPLHALGSLLGGPLGPRTPSGRETDRLISRQLLVERQLRETARLGGAVSEGFKAVSEEGGFRAKIWIMREPQRLKRQV